MASNKRKSGIILQCILCNRSLYILNMKCNLVFGQILIPLIKILLMIAFTITFFILFRLYKHLNLLTFSLFALTVWTALLLLIPLTFVISEMYKTSKKFIPQFTHFIWKLQESASSKAILQRQLKSCNIIRCKVGGMYYMESAAKLTVLHKLVNGLKQLFINVKIR